MIPFSRDNDIVSAQFTSDEAVLLRSLAGQLDEMLSERNDESAASSPADALFAQLGMGGPGSAPHDPAIARLVPDAYREDAEAASEHRRLTERGLIDRKIANAGRMIADLGPVDGSVAEAPVADAPVAVRLDAAGVQAWLRALTDLRLTLAARLGIEEDGDEGHGSAEMTYVYDWLGAVQGLLVETIDD